MNKTVISNEALEACFDRTITPVLDEMLNELKGYKPDTSVQERQGFEARMDLQLSSEGYSLENLDMDWEGGDFYHQAPTFKDAEGKNSVLAQLGVGKSKTVEFLRWSAKMLVAGAKLTAQGFSKAFEELWVALDGTGQRGIDQARKLIHDTPGTAEGVFVNKRLQHRLSVNGVVPDNFEEMTQLTVTHAKYVAREWATDLANLMRSCANIVGPMRPKDALHFHKDMMKLVGLVNKHRTPDDHHRSVSPASVYLGSVAAFTRTRRVSQVVEHKDITDNESLALLNILAQLDWRLNKRPQSVSGKMLTTSLKILSRSEMADLLAQAQKLSECLKMLQQQARVSKSDYTNKYVAQAIEQTVEALKGNVQVQGDVSYDTSVKIESDDLVRADWLQHYFESTSNNHMQLLLTYSYLVASTLTAYLDYIHASLKQYK